MTIKRLRTRLLITTALAAATMLFVAIKTNKGTNRYVSATPSLTQRLVDIPSEGILLDFCARLQEVHGITGVMYRDFSPVTHTAIVTVFYDPHRTSPIAVRSFVRNSRVLWVKPVAA